MVHIAATIATYITNKESNKKGKVKLCEMQGDIFILQLVCLATKSFPPILAHFAHEFWPNVFGLYSGDTSIYYMAGISIYIYKKSGPSIKIDPFDWFLSGRKPAVDGSYLVSMLLVIYGILVRSLGGKNWQDSDKADKVSISFSRDS